MQKASNDAEKEVYVEKIKQLQEQLRTLQDDKVNINKRLENTRAGYVYIISNVGSFGENIYKIGVTRRLEPRDRVKELSSASVPFEFDIHAIIFSDDAPKLENTLHKYFREHELNKINPRKEFFKVDLEEIKKVVLQKHNDTVRFEMEAEAHQYRETLKLIESAS
ncbi:GIY-YIG nuclease family protein [Mammaliicoccus vitulinus]|uniref:GIY-YIG nuclease family protein n=1 Tax=Mammaliicoccus vitulinus TaxID=71237 RepID=UPI00248D195B|nr:GIY-YIG nuclease family protein [Mammaliicoccus vitulinus]